MLDAGECVLVVFGRDMEVGEGTKKEVNYKIGAIFFTISLMRPILRVREGVERNSGLFVTRDADGCGTIGTRAIRGGSKSFREAGGNDV
jgi:hypothetical protein